MKAKNLIELLKEVDPEASVELSRVLAMNPKKQEQDPIELRLDFPIIGIAAHDTSGEVLLVVEDPENQKHLAHYGTIHKFDPDA